MLITLYAREEPTTDPIARATTRDFGARLPFDTVLYRDRDATEPKLRWPWHVKGRPVRRLFAMFNCYRWRLEWLPRVEA